MMYRKKITFWQAHTLVEKYVSLGCDADRFVTWMTDMGITTSSLAIHAFVNIDHHWKTNGPMCQQELAEIREQR